MTQKNEHPLQFFKNLIDDPKGIDLLKSKFLPHSTPDPDQDERDLAWYVERNWEEGYYTVISPLEDGPETFTHYFSDHLERKCNDAKLEFLKTLDIHVLNEEDEKKASAYLKKIVTEIHFLISQGNENERIQKYPIIHQTLQAIKDQIVGKYGVVDISSKNAVQATGYSKIQWLGKINVLTTLFYDLLNGVKSEGIHPLIKATPKDIERLIVENFIDQDGKEFDMGGTIKEYLKPSKQTTKRAKGEVSIEIKKNE